MKKNPDGSYTATLEERVAALEMFILTFSEAMSEDDDGPGEFANEQRRWREAHVAARARRQRERAP
jgi:hypothetical protein